MANFSTNLVKETGGEKSVGKWEADYPITAERLNQTNQALLNNIAIKKYVSSQQNQEMRNTQLTHNLGKIPEIVYYECVCLVANSGYSVGDKVRFTDIQSSHFQVKSITDTTITIYSSRKSIPAKNAMNFISATLTHWRVIVTAIAMP